MSAADLGVERCDSMPVLAAAAATCQTAPCRGHGDEDKGGVIRVFEDPRAAATAAGPAG